MTRRSVKYSYLVTYALLEIILPKCIAGEAGLLAVRSQETGLGEGERGRIWRLYVLISGRSLGRLEDGEDMRKLEADGKKRISEHVRSGDCEDQVMHEFFTFVL